MKKQHGGKRPGAGRKANKKTGKKIVWLGLRWDREELDDVLAVLEQEQITNKSLFVVRSTVEAARKILNDNQNA